MISLSDRQLHVVMTADADIAPERRSQFLERLSAMLTLRGRGHFDDDDVIDCAALARCGLVQKQTDAA